MNQKLLTLICLICLSCSGANTEITENTDHDWVPCGYGIEFCSKFENDPPNLCEETTSITTAFVKINGKTYIFVNSYCVAQPGSFQETCPYGHSNRPLSFTYDQAEDIKINFNEPYVYDQRLSFAGYHKDDFDNLRQFCNDVSESKNYQMCGHNVNLLKSVCNAWIWAYNQEGRRTRQLINYFEVRTEEITTLPDVSNTGVVLVFK